MDRTLSSPIDGDDSDQSNSELSASFNEEYDDAIADHLGEPNGDSSDLDDRRSDGDGHNGNGHNGDEDTAELIAELTATERRGRVPSPLLRIADRAKHRRVLHSLVLIMAVALLVIPAYTAYQQAEGKVPIYEAELDVLYQIDRANFGETDTIIANAMIVAEQRALRETVATVSGIDTQNLIENSSVEQVESASGSNSSVLRFKVRSVNRDNTLLLVGLWVDEFLAVVVEDDPDEDERLEINATIEELRRQRDEAREAIEEAEEQKEDAVLEQLSNTRRAQLSAELDRDVAAAGARYDEIIRDINTHALLLAQLEPVGTQVAITRLGDGFIMPEPVFPKPMVSLALGLAIGLVLSATYLFIWSQIRLRNRFPPQAGP